MPRSRARVAVLASGGGTNLQAILDHFAALGARAHGEVTVVISDRDKAGALDRARRAGITTEHVPASALTSSLGPLLASHRIDVIALAGFLRMVPRDVTRTYAGRIVNVHPALLPAFGGTGMYGHHVHEAVIASGAKESGATVHLVDDVYDNGAILEQSRVPVLPGDTPDSLATRVLVAEHELYPRVLNELCGRVAMSH